MYNKNYKVKVNDTSVSHIRHGPSGGFFFPKKCGQAIPDSPQGGSKEDVRSQETPS